MSFWSRVKGRKTKRDEGERSLRQSRSCEGLVGQSEARLSLAHFLAEARPEDGYSQSEETGSLTSWTSLVKQRSRLSKSVKVIII